MRATAYKPRIQRHHVPVRAQDLAERMTLRIAHVRVRHGERPNIVVRVSIQITLHLLRRCPAVFLIVDDQAHSGARDASCSGALHCLCAAER